MTIAAVAAVAIVLAGCSGSATPAAQSQQPPAAEHAPAGVPPVPAGDPYHAFSVAGPYRAGVATVTTPSGDPVVIYYPVDPAATAGRPTYSVDLLKWFTGSPTEGVPAGLPQNLPTTLATDAYAGVPISAEGPFPVVLFSHGAGGYPEQSSNLTDNIATWGFVVLAPDHRSRDLHAEVTNATGRGQNDVADLRDALAMARRMNASSGTLLSHKLDLADVASLGHSAGGGAAISVATYGDIKTYIGLAPSRANPPPSKPGMLVQGTSDTVVTPRGTIKLYGRLPAPKRLVLIDGAGHNVFDDACVIGASQGGLVSFVDKLGLPASFTAIATDGCVPPDVYPPTAWPLIDHVIVAQLRWGLGIDRAAVGLGSGLDRAYPGVTAQVRSDGS